MEANVIENSVRAFYLEKNYQKVVDILSPLGKQYDISAANYLKGHALVQIGETEKAKKVLSKATTSAPANYEAGIYLATINKRAKNYADAEKDMERVIKYMPVANPKYYYHLSDVQRLQKKFDKALETQNSLLSKRPDAYLAYDQPAKIFKDKGLDAISQHYEVLFKKHRPAK